MKLFVLLSLSLLVFLPTTASSQLPVVPGAQGWGVETPAGRGGTIYRVTNLSSSGTGSLKTALSASGPRTIIFEVSGTIVLTNWLFIDNPFVTVAGQTAPSPGITIRGGGIRVRTHDVLIQHLRVRVGDGNGPAALERDGIEILANEQNCYNILIDHCSFSWAIDENMSIYSPNSQYTNHDITFRYCISSEGLFNSIHPEGAHSMGVLVGGNSGGRHDNISFVLNLMAHNNQRNPMSQSRSFVNVNSVAYDWGEYAVTLMSEGATNKSADVGNIYIAGPSSSNDPPITLSRYLIPGSQVYIDDDTAEGFDEIYSNYTNFNPIVTTPPFWPGDLVAQPSTTTRLNVLANAGARPTDRDAVDVRVVNDVLAGTGSLIDSQNDVGGWPVLQQTTRALTTPTNPNSDTDGDGYTNLEEWLHSYSTGVGGDGINKMVGIVYPNGGETLVSDSVRDIMWETTSGISNVKLEYTTNGTTWTVIQTSTTNDGSYSWTVPNIATSTAMVRVSDVASPTVIDQSNSNFSITQTAPVVTILSEGFETNVVPGSSWSTDDWNGNGGKDYWGDQSNSSGARVHSGTKSAYCADNSNISGQTYDVSENTYMDKKDGVEVDGYTGVQMKYWVWYKTDSSNDYVRLEYKSGSQWIEIERFSGSGSGSQVWTQRTVAVPSNAGSTFYFRWVFLSNSSGSSEGVYIDDIAITGNPSFAPMELPDQTLKTVVEPESIPEQTTLHQNFPNPFNPTTRISFNIASDSHVKLSVFNVLGQEVALLVDGPMAAGAHTAEFDGRNLADGVYFSVLENGGSRLLKKMILLK